MDRIATVNLSLFVIAVTFTYAGAVAARAWLTGRARSLRWIALAMFGLAFAWLTFRFSSFSTTADNRGAIYVAAFAAITIAQWSLLRFAIELAELSTRTRRIADIAFGTTIAAELVIPDRIAFGMYAGPAQATFVHVVMALFSIYATGLGAVLLWRAGRRMPSLVRNRYRMLAISIVTLYAAMTLAGVREYPALLVFALLLIGSTLLIVVAAMPPQWLRDAWQAPLLRRVLRELADVSGMTDQDAVRARLLPTIARAASAQRAVMHDAGSGRELETFGPRSDAAVERVLLPSGSIALDLVGVPHDPFFGGEQRQLVEDLALHLQVALERCSLIARERDVASTMSAANVRLRSANAELVELAELRDGFVAIASHELRTPITTIVGFTRTLLDLWDDIEDPERRRYLELVDRDAHRLSQLVSDLLMLSSVESPDFRVVRERVDVGALLGQVVADVGVDAAGVELHVEQSLSVHADPRLVRQVFVNLVANATRHGAPPIRLRARPVGEFGDKVQVEVRDEGPGVPEEFRDRLFGRFARADQSAAIPGSGLGLFIVRRLVEVQGGRVWLEDDDTHGGACFVVELPSSAARPAATWGG